MTARHSTLSILISLTALGLTACGGAVDNSNSAQNSTPDGVEKEREANEDLKKSDAWNWLNNPERFQTDLTYKWSRLKEEAQTGETEAEVWPDTYWPMYKDGINQRWQGEQTLSPAEKYDRVYNDWEPEEGFSEYMDLQPFDTETCNWDEAYYEQLGPAATSASKRKGNWQSHNGRDDDGDGIADKNECGYGEDKDYDGVETWFGLCHAWVPAAMMEKEPKEPVTVETDDGEDVTFEVADIKALLVSQYDQADAHMVGGRCNDKTDEIDRNKETGRIEDGKCQDVNPGSFHVLITNFLGLQGRPIAEDRVFDYEVWNQPIIGYEITSQEQISEEKVQQLVTSEDPDENSQPETDEERQAVLQAANDLSESELADSAGVNPENVEAIVTYRNENDGFADYETLETETGERTVSRLLGHLYDFGELEQDDSIYDYNKHADRYVKVETSVDYVTESEASTEPMFDRIDEFTRTDTYRYILELDGQGKITGGEWIGRSVEDHPDFLWLPTSPGGGNPDVELEQVRELLAKSTGSNSTTDAVQTYENTETASIPDNDPEGLTSTVSVEADGAVSDLTVDLEVDHAYKGDLVIALEKEGTSSVVFNGDNVDNSWENDVSLSGQTVEGFEGIDAAGDWKLNVVDTIEDDTGELKSWSLNLRTE
jgi:subtilisin-like proprotein convertase family protein